MFRLVSRPSARRALHSVPRDAMPPFQKHRTNTSVLEALSRATGITFTNHSIPQDNFFDLTNIFNAQSGETLLQKGREAARFFLQRDANLYAKFCFAEPKTNAFKPVYSADNVGEDSERNLERLIAAFEDTAALQMFERLTENNTKLEAVSSGARLRLLELLAAKKGDLHLRTSPGAFISQMREPETNVLHWDTDCPAEKFFATFEGEERSREAYQAMIRGASARRGFERALQLYAEMQTENLTPDLPTFNALLRSAEFAEEGAWNCVLKIYRDLLDAGLQPNVQSFNAMLRAMLKEDQWRVISILQEMNIRKVKPNVGTLSTLCHQMTVFPESNMISDQLIQVMTKLLASAGRLEFSEPEDLLLSTHIFDVVYDLNLEQVLKLEALYKHSPYLWLTYNDSFLFLNRVFNRLSRFNVKQAHSFFMNCIVNNPNVLWNKKFRMLPIIIKAAPDTIDKVFSHAFYTLLSSIGRREDLLIKDLFALLEKMHETARAHRSCQEALFRSAQYYMRCYNKDMPMTTAMGCMLIAVCVPKADVKNMHERVALAWDVFQVMKKNDPLPATYNMILFCAGLVEQNRLHDAAVVLRTIIKASELKEAQNFISDSYAQFEQLLSKEDLVDFLKEQDPHLLTLARDWLKEEKIKPSAESSTGKMSKKWVDKKYFKSGKMNEEDLLSGDHKYGEKFGELFTKKFDLTFDTRSPEVPSIDNSDIRLGRLSRQASQNVFSDVSSKEKVSKETRARRRQRKRQDSSSSSSDSDSDKE